MVYVTPEYTSNCIEVLMEIHQEQPIICFAIDEAHCVSQWGHDFRDSYRVLRRLRQISSQIPILACTATATPEVRRDICTNLALKSPIETITDFDRQNICISVFEKKEPLEDILSLPCVTRSKNGKYDFDGCTIIYCLSINQCEDMNYNLRKAGFNVGEVPYHSQRSPKERAELHENFTQDRINAIVATIAFGMGVDKPNVRNVIHYGAPKSPEGYYQEIGRAGRDGLQSHAFSFWSKKDITIQQNFLKDITNTNALAQAQKNLALIQVLFKTGGCRRLKLLHHFDKNATSELHGTPECCDNCKKGSSTTKVDGSKYVNVLFGAVDQVNSLSKVLKFIRGSRAKEITETMKSKPFYGAGKEMTEKFWSELLDQMVADEYITKKANQFAGPTGYAVTYYTLILEVKARRWREKYQLNKKNPFMIESHALTAPKASNESVKVSPEKASKLPLERRLDNEFLKKFMAGPWLDEKVATKSPEESKIERLLYKRLKNVRSEIANEYDMKPINVAGDDDLVLLSAVRPSSLEKMQNLEGFSAVKCNRLTRIVKTIATFSEDNEIDLDQPIVEKYTPTKVSNFDEISNSPLSPVVQITYDLFRAGKDVKAIEKETKQKRPIIFLHLSNAIESGWAVNCSRLKVSALMVEQTIQEITKNGSKFPKIDQLSTALGENSERTKICLALVRLIYGLGRCSYTQKRKSFEDSER